MATQAPLALQRGSGLLGQRRLASHRRHAHRCRPLGCPVEAGAPGDVGSSFYQALDRLNALVLSSCAAASGLCIYMRVRTAEMALISVFVILSVVRCVLLLGLAGAGDGKYHELQLKVTSYSIKEDWVMGISYLQYEYPTPFHSKVPLYEMNGQLLHYVSTPDDKDSTQPFKTVPWTVEFKGCCRWYEGKTDLSPKPDEMVNFNIRATVDLSNRIASPRLVVMPFFYTKPQEQSLVPVCALSAGGRAGMVSKNGGTINYRQDDNATAKFTWSVKGFSASVQEQAGSKDGRCVMLSLGRSPLYQREDRDFVTIEVRMGNALVTGDYAIYVKGPGDIINQQNARAPFGCRVGTICESELSLSKRMPIFAGAPTLIDFRSTTSLEIRYIVATSTHQSTMLSTGQGTLQYSLTDVGQDHAGLPAGASMAPVMIAGTGGVYVTSLDVVFSADQENTRPGVNQFISNGQRDYTSHYTAEAGWQLVEGSNFNQKGGGAHISVYMEKARQLSTDLTDLRHMAAITGVELAIPSQVAGFLEKGYQKLDKNLLEQSDRGEIFIMYKRGSGPPVLDVKSMPTAGYKHISTSTSNSQGKIATINMFVQYNDELRVARSLTWTPCTGQDEEVIICAMASAWNVSNNNPSAAYGTTMQCMLMDVVPTTPPKFIYAEAKDKVYQAYMGLELEIGLKFKRTDLPLTTRETIPTVRFGMKGDTSTKPTDPSRVLDLLTDRTTTGSRITGVDKMGTGLSAVTTASDSSAFGESAGFLLWTPSPYQGGWKGEVCIDACIPTSACPATVGGAVEVCSQTCFSVVVDRCKWALVRSCFHQAFGALKLKMPRAILSQPDLWGNRKSIFPRFVSTNGHKTRKSRPGTRLSRSIFPDLGPGPKRSKSISKNEALCHARPFWCVVEGLLFMFDVAVVSLDVQA